MERPVDDQGGYDVGQDPSKCKAKALGANDLYNDTFVAAPAPVVLHPTTPGSVLHPSTPGSTGNQSEMLSARKCLPQRPWASFTNMV